MFKMLIHNFFYEYLIFDLVTGKSKQEQLPCEKSLQKIEIFRTFLRAKQVGKKLGKFQLVV